MAKEPGKERRLVFHPRNWRYRAMTGGKPIKNSWLDVDTLAGRYMAVAMVIMITLWAASRAYWYWEIEKMQRQVRKESLLTNGLYFLDMRALMARERPGWNQKRANPDVERSLDDEVGVGDVVDLGLEALKNRCIVRLNEEGGNLSAMIMYGEQAAQIADVIELKERSRPARTAILKELAREARRRKDARYTWCLLGVMGTGGSGQLAERKEAAMIYVDCYLAFNKWPTVKGEVVKILAQYPMAGNVDDVVRETISLAEQKGAKAGTEYLLERVVPTRDGSR